MTKTTDDLLQQEFKEFLKQKVEKTRQDLAMLESLINSKPFGVIQSEPTIEVKSDGYNYNWTWKQKIEFILMKKSATTAEIVDEILKHEPNRYIRSKVVASISAVLSVGSKENGIYTKSPNVRGENVYALASVN